MREEESGNESKEGYTKRKGEIEREREIEGPSEDMSARDILQLEVFCFSVSSQTMRNRDAREKVLRLSRLF